MPITSIITIAPLPDSFPSDCRFIGGRDGDMKALGQTLGISVYKELYLTTLSGVSSVPAEGNGWNIKVINRFIEQRIVYRHKAKLYLRALPASPQILNEDIPQRVRVGLVVACWGIRSRIRTAELAWIKHTALHGSSPLWTFALDVSCDVANRGQANARIEQLIAKTGAEHITPKKISEAVSRKGAAYWVTWYRHWDKFCAASEVKEGAAYLYRLVTNSNDTLPYSIPEDLVSESEDLATPNPEDLAKSMPEDLVENPEDLVENPEDLVENPEDLVLDPPLPYKGTPRTIGTHGSSRAPAHVREAEGHEMDGMDDHENEDMRIEIRAYLRDTWNCDAGGITALLRDHDLERVYLKYVYLDTYLDGKNSDGLKNPAGYVMSLLRDSDPDALWDYARTAESEFEIPAAAAVRRWTAAERADRVAAEREAVMRVPEKERLAEIAHWTAVLDAQTQAAPVPVPPVQTSAQRRQSRKEEDARLQGWGPASSCVIRQVRARFGTESYPPVRVLDRDQMNIAHLAQCEWELWPDDVVAQKMNEKFSRQYPIPWTAQKVSALRLRAAPLAPVTDTEEV